MKYNKQKNKGGGKEVIICNYHQVMLEILQRNHGTEGLKSVGQSVSDKWSIKGAQYTQNFTG